MRIIENFPAAWRRTVLLLAALVAAAGLAACDRDGQASAVTTPEIAPVERRDLEVRAEASGLLEPVRTVEVKSKASGEILRLMVDTGDQVTRGQLLAEIDPRDVQNAFNQAEADHEVAAARVQTTSTQHRRARELWKAGLVTEQDLETAGLEEVNARAQLVKANTNLTLARQKLGDVTITAPMDGTVTSKLVEAGQIIASASGNVSGGTTLMTLSELSQMQMRALVDETDIGRIQQGLPARVTVEAYPDRTFRGRVEKVEPQAVVEQNVTMFPVLVRLENPERLLKPGMNADVEIDVARRENAIVVPNSAVVSLRDAAAAAEVLGLDPETVRASMRRGRSGEAPAGTAGQPRQDTAGEATAAADGERSWRRGASGGEERGEGGEGGSGADRTERADRNDRDDRSQAGAAGEGRSGGQGGARAWGSGGSQAAVVFVATPQGPEARRVMLGLSDWDDSEVVRGLEPGERVHLLSVARLQQQQERFTDRMRERAGGPFPGARSGGSSGRGGGR